MNGTTKTRRLAIRGGLLVIYVLLMVLMIMTGRRHTILIDNKDAADGSYSAINGMEVAIDRQKSSEYYPGDRDKAMVQGQTHKIKVTIFDDNKTIEKEFKVPLWSDVMIISVPKLIAGIEPWIEPFTMAEQIQEAQESGPPAGETSFQSIGPAQPMEVEQVPPTP
jgi:hypothetical protein